MQLSDKACRARLQMIDLSAEHITESTWYWLDEEVDADVGAVWATRWKEYGFIVHTGLDNNEDGAYGVDAPQDIQDLLRWARENSFHYVKIDRDADILADVPTYGESE